MNKIRPIAMVVATFFALASAASAQSAWPRRVLVTNDNGIDDTATIELARALAKFSDTYVVASMTDRSGTSNLLTATREGEFRTERRDLGDGIEAWALDGQPADCVVFAVSGPMREQPPDLVVSGINGGANLGDEWFGSGTIGAARTAAYFGIPALAISGVEDDDPYSVRAAVEWTVRLVKSKLVRELKAPQYLTVSLPLVSPELIEGVEVVERARGLLRGAATLVREDGRRETWQLTFDANAPADERTDVAAVDRRMIAVVPMRVDDFDSDHYRRLRRQTESLPEWLPPPPPAERQCRSRLGIVFDDAEDESGREWGVVIEEVMDGGKAQELGLRVGDVIVVANGVALETERTSSIDPDDLFVDLLGRLTCGDQLTLELVREGSRSTVSYRYEDPQQP